MRELDLLHSLPKSPKPVADRKATKTPEVVEIARKFGRNYFDGDRAYGYGGYKDDGRWKSVAADMKGYYGYGSWTSILDVGCAKGFLVNELRLLHNIHPFGLDISRYAIMNCHPKVVGRLHHGTAYSLPFPDKSFDVVVSINTLHNLSRDLCIQALREIVRVSKGKAFVQVDAYRNEREKQLFLDWNLTALTHGTPDDWFAIFKEAGYDGDFWWTIT